MKKKYGKVERLIETLKKKLFQRMESKKICGNIIFVIAEPTKISDTSQ